MSTQPVQGSLDVTVKVKLEDRGKIRGELKLEGTMCSLTFTLVLIYFGLVW